MSRLAGPAHPGSAQNRFRSERTSSQRPPDIRRRPGIATSPWITLLGPPSLLRVGPDQTVRIVPRREPSAVI